MKYSVELIEEAREDFKKLDNSQRIQVAKQLKKLESNPYKGKQLGKKFNIDLSGYYKLYAVQKKIRVVYTVVEDQVLVEIITIGKREEFAVYKEAFKRIKKSH